MPSSFHSEPEDDEKKDRDVEEVKPHLEPHELGQIVWDETTTSPRQSALNDT